ncbi:hypothetical protein C8N45_10822 [Yoonia sediminilitoris]|uniref:Uncharacterized protein n=1 Tax=Yoonia sediminilitoris TaxID=1286148 RepID=A0A2T6KDH6_9RHOB|nr:hypothetical protein C8N45_10822 [Yoonia sediminilitoris]
MQAAVEAERDAFLASFAERHTSDGRYAVVRSGYHPERAVQTGIGPVTVKVPKVRVKDVGHAKPIHHCIRFGRDIAEFVRSQLIGTGNISFNYEFGHWRSPIY